jgi:hypothetical protein
VLVREPAGAHPAERELALLEPRRFRKEAEHVASIEIPMQELLLT